MTRSTLLLSAGLVLLSALEAQAQPAPTMRPCTPTLSNPCKPPPALGSTVTSTTNPYQVREPTRLDQSVIPDVQFDRHTPFGVGHAGIIGIERKFDPKDY